MRPGNLFATIIVITLVVASGVFALLYAVVGFKSASGGTAPDWVTAGATVILAVVTALLAVVGAYQIRAVQYQQRTWTSLQACDRYDLEATIVTAREYLASEANKFRTQKNYSTPELRQQRLVRSVARLMNFFDAIAIGIAQGLYREELVKEHLEGVVEYTLRDIITCRAIDRIGSLYTGRNSYYSAFSKLVSKWNINLSEIEVEVGKQLAAMNSAADAQASTL